MSAALCRILRTLAVFALLLGATASHDVAMAGAGTTASMFGIAAKHMSVDHHGAHHACPASGCEASGTPCCVMGHCLLGIPLSAGSQFEIAVAPDFEADVLPGEAAGLVWAPFRPPASV